MRSFVNYSSHHAARCLIKFISAQCNIYDGTYTGTQLNIFSLCRLSIFVHAHVHRQYTSINFKRTFSTYTETYVLNAGFLPGTYWN